MSNFCVYLQVVEGNSDDEINVEGAGAKFCDSSIPRLAPSSTSIAAGLVVCSGYTRFRPRMFNSLCRHKHDVHAHRFGGNGRGQSDGIQNRRPSASISLASKCYRCKTIAASTQIDALMRMMSLVYIQL